MRKPPFYRSVGHAFNGLVWILRHERNYQIEIFAFLINLFLIVWLQLSTVDTLFILLVCFFVLIAEILNTCIEKLCDIVQYEYDDRIKIIKDLAAGAVILSSISAIVVAIFIYPKYINALVFS